MEVPMPSEASSATSASPPMAFLQPATSVSSNPADEPDNTELDPRATAIQKFLLRAEMSMVARGLRTRLSYASYKANNNLAHVPFRDLESRSASQAASYRTAGTKRKAAGFAHHASPGPQGNGGGGVAPSPAQSSTRRGAMLPPSGLASASRSPHVGNLSTASISNRTANATQSLYASLLIPPPAKHPRIAQNPNDVGDRRTAANPRAPRGSRATAKSTPRKSAASAQAKSRRDDKNKDKYKSPDKGKGRERATTSSSIGEDAEIKAAATLTSLLLHSRPSIAGSPRSSKSAGSDGGSAHSFNFTHPNRMGVVASFSEPSFAARVSTPPPSSRLHPGSAHSTPKASGSVQGRFGDSEAADLMLFLATSPSPARPNSNRERDAKGGPAYRTLSGGPGLRTAGRVLFTNSADTGASGGSGTHQVREPSVGSNVSSRGDQGVGEGNDVTPTPDGGESDDKLDEDDSAVNAEAEEAPSTPDNHPHLLPGLPPSPAATSSPGSWTQSARYVPGDSKSTLRGSRTPSTASFNLNDFINVTPSPASRPAVPRGDDREDVSRRLFEEEQQRQGSTAVDDVGGSPESTSLGAGIDLVQN